MPVGLVRCMHMFLYLSSSLEARRIITGEPCLFCGCRSASEVTETEVYFTTATSRGVLASNYKY